MGGNTFLSSLDCAGVNGQIVTILGSNTAERWGCWAPRCTAMSAPGSTAAAGLGLKGPLSCLTQARSGIAWGVIGAAQACLAQLLGAAGRELTGVSAF